MATAETGTGDADTFNDVFKSLDDVMKCLHSEKYFHLPEVKRLLEIYNRYISVIHDEVVDRSQRKVFIVLEGMDASGKSTISKRLAKLIGGRMLSTPPPILAWLRNQFDKHGGELRRAYYALGNYLAAQQVKEIYKTQPVVMDRFWHSTATYAIAKHAVEESDGKVPEAGHEIYKWPEDLVKPDIVFLLCVSESKRIERLLCRSKKEITPEELMTKDNEALRKAMHKAYLNMVNPGVRTINANNKYALPTCTKILTEENLVQVSQPETKAFDNELRQELKVLRDTLPLLTKHMQDCELMATSQQQANVFYEQVELMIDHAISTQLQFLSLNKDA